MWIFFVLAFLVVVALAILNARARSRLEKLGGGPDDPTRRHWWMRSGG